MSVVRKNIYLLFFVQTSNYIFPLLTLPYLVRVLGAEEFGNLAMAQAWIQYAILIVDYGFNLSATQKLSIVKGDFNKVSEIFTSTILSKFILLTGLYILFLVYALFVGYTDFLRLITIHSIAVVGAVIFPIWLFQGLEKMEGILISSSVAKLLSLLFIFLFVTDSSDVEVAAFAQGCSMFITGVLSMYYLKSRKLASFVSVNPFMIKKNIVDGFDLFISNLSISFYTTLNVLIIGYFSGPTMAGYFSAADKLRVAAQGILSPFQQAIFPRVSHLVASGATLNDILKSYGIKFILLGGLVSVSILVVGYPLSGIYFGSGYEISSTMLALMAPVPFLVSVGIVFGQWWIITNNNTKVIRYTYMIVASFHVSLSLIMIKFLPVYGVVMTVSISELLACLVFFCYLYKTGGFLNEKHL